MRYYHNQHIGVYENAVSDEWCNKVIEYFENNTKYASPRDEEGGSLVGIRDTQLALEDPALVEEFNSFFDKTFKLYKYKYTHVPLPLENISYKLQKTLPTEGYHPYHIERDGTLPTIKREMVYTVYLNDVEEGGETEFLYQLTRLKPKKGTLCLFPAGYTHVHRGNTPLSGEKYIMTGWLTLAIDNILN